MQKVILGRVFLRVHPFPPSVTFRQCFILNSFTDTYIILAVDSVFVHEGQIKTEPRHTENLSRTYPHKIYAVHNLAHVSIMLVVIFVISQMCSTSVNRSLNMHYLIQQIVQSVIYKHMFLVFLLHVSTSTRLSSRTQENLSRKGM